MLRTFMFILPTFSPEEKQFHSEGFRPVEYCQVKVKLCQWTPLRRLAEWKFISGHS